MNRQRGIQAALVMLKLAALPPGMSAAAFKNALKGGQAVGASGAAAAAETLAHNPFKALAPGAVPVAGKVNRSVFERGFARTLPPGADPAQFTAGQFEWLGKGQMPPQALASVGGGRNAPSNPLAARLSGKIAPAASGAARTAAELPVSGVAARLQALRPTRA